MQRLWTLSGWSWKNLSSNESNEENQKSSIFHSPRRCFTAVKRLYSVDLRNKIALNTFKLRVKHNTNGHLLIHLTLAICCLRIAYIFSDKLHILCIARFSRCHQSLMLLLLCCDKFLFSHKLYRELCAVIVRLIIQRRVHCIVKHVRANCCDVAHRLKQTNFLKKKAT